MHICNTRQKSPGMARSGRGSVSWATHASVAGLGTCHIWPGPRQGGVRVVDVGSSYSWGEFGALFLSTRSTISSKARAREDRGRGLMPEDTKEAHGPGICAKRS
jgi:hypothetical protein